MNKSPVLASARIADQVADLITQKFGVHRLDAELLVRPLALAWEEAERWEHRRAAADLLDRGFD